MQEVYVSSIIPAPVAEVWKVVGDYGKIADWHPIVKTSSYSDEATINDVGAVRACTLADGGQIKERLSSRSEEEYSFSYEYLEWPMPADNAGSAVRLRPVTDGDRTFIEWRMSFEPEPGAEKELPAMLQEVITMGFENLKALFSNDA